MLYLYAITESDRIPAIEGLRRATLTAVGEPGLLAVVSAHDELEPDQDDLWTHEQVVEGLTAGGPVLPMRFGSWLPDEPAVHAFLSERRQALEEAFERVRGAVELSVRVAIGPAPEGRDQTAADDQATDSGTAYLLDRLKVERNQKEVTQQIHRPLASLARASTSWSGEPPRRHWKAAYLVSRDRIEEFIEQIDRLDSELSGGAVICTGPWPPYSFTAGEAVR
jgi:hypothetical protein